MKLTNIIEGKIYEFKNIDSLNDHLNGERIMIKEIIDEYCIMVDFLDHKRPILVDATEGKIEYRPLLNMVISADEVRRAKN